MTPYNQTAICHLNMMEAFLLPLEILLYAHEKPASDHYFVEEALSFSPSHVSNLHSHKTF
jgi:hypothetical protein